MSADDDDDKIGTISARDLELVALGELAKHARKGSTPAARALAANLSRRSERKEAARRHRELDKLLARGETLAVCEALGKVGASDRECYVLLGREMTPTEQASYDRGEVLRSITARQSAIEHDLQGGEVSVVGVDSASSS